MLRLRPMTGFAIHPGVLSGLFQIMYVTVTCLTSLMSGEVRRSRADLRDCGSPVVPVLAERFGNNIAPNRPEHQKCHDKKSRKSKQMCCVFETVHPALIPAAGQLVDTEPVAM